MKSSKIMTVLVSFLIGVLGAVAYQYTREVKQTPLEEANKQAIDQMATPTDYKH